MKTVEQIISKMEKELSDLNECIDQTLKRYNDGDEHDQVYASEDLDIFNHHKEIIEEQLNWIRS